MGRGDRVRRPLLPGRGLLARPPARRALRHRAAVVEVVENVPQVAPRLGEEAAVVGDHLEVVPRRRPDAVRSPSLQHARTRGDTREWVASTTRRPAGHLGELLGDEVQRAAATTARPPAVRERTGPRHEPPGAEQRHERLPVRHGVEGRIGRPRLVSSQVMNRASSRPARSRSPPRPGVAHHGEPLVQRRLAPRAGCGGWHRSSLGVSDGRHRQRLHQVDLPDPFSPTSTVQRARSRYRRALARRQGC